MMQTLRFDAENALPILRNLCGRSQKEVLAYFPEVDPWPLFWTLRQPAELGWCFDREGAGAILTAQKKHSDGWSISMLTTDNFQRLAKPLTKRIVGHIIPLFRDLGAKRLECCSLGEPSPMQKWMTRSLGARQDKVLRQHGRNNEDFVLFVWDL
jgi:hypothetical protein